MTTNIDLAREVARKVVLHSITLCRANVETNLDPLAIPPEIGMTQGHRCEYIKELKDGTARLSVVTEFKFTAKEMDGNEELSDLMTLDATFRLIYSLPFDIQVHERCFKHFADVNGPYNSWPYWRELVQTTTGRVGLAGITVPVFRPRAVEVSDSECMVSGKKKTKKKSEQRGQ